MDLWAYTYTRTNVKRDGFQVLRLIITSASYRMQRLSVVYSDVHKSSTLVEFSCFTVIISGFISFGLVIGGSFVPIVAVAQIASPKLDCRL